MVVENTSFENNLRYQLRVQNSLKGILGKERTSLEFSRVDAGKVKKKYEMVKLRFICLFTQISPLLGWQLFMIRYHVDKLNYLLTILPLIFILVETHCGPNILPCNIDFGLGHMVLASEI